MKDRTDFQTKDEFMDYLNTLKQTSLGCEDSKRINKPVAFDRIEYDVPQAVCLKKISAEGNFKDYSCVVEKIEGIEDIEGIEGGLEGTCYWNEQEFKFEIKD